jgi:hypothetical protein
VREERERRRALLVPSLAQTCAARLLFRQQGTYDLRRRLRLQMNFGRQRPNRSDKQRWRIIMGRGLLLWLIGIPIPIILLIWVFGGLH